MTKKHKCLVCGHTHRLSRGRGKKRGGASDWSCMTKGCHCAKDDFAPIPASARVI